MGFQGEKVQKAGTKNRSLRAAAFSDRRQRAAIPDYRPEAGYQMKIRRMIQKKAGMVQAAGNKVPASSSLPVIQRRMGFEFETGTYIFDGNYFADHLLDDEHDAYTGNNWKIVSDSGRLEFVSDPRDNMTQLDAVIAEMATFITAASNLTHNDDVTTIGAGTWDDHVASLPAEGRGDLIARISSSVAGDAAPDAASLRGNPQVSLGIEMNKLGQFLKSAPKARVLQNLHDRLRTDRTTGQRNDYTTGQVDRKVRGILSNWSGKKVSQASKKIEMILKRKTKGDVRKLRGLWNLMASYLMWLKKWNGGGYIKSKLAIMARTDFHSMFNTLSAAEQAYYLDLSTEFLTRFGGYSKITRTQFTPMQWYASVAGEGTMPSRPDTDREDEDKDVDLMSDTAGPARGTNKSMGQLGIDTAQGGEKAVFELRHITGGIKIPIDYMSPYILSHIDNWIRTSGYV